MAKISKLDEDDARSALRAIEVAADRFQQEYRIARCSGKLGDVDSALGSLAFATCQNYPAVVHAAVRLNVDAAPVLAWQATVYESSMVLPRDPSFTKLARFESVHDSWPAAYGAMKNLLYAIGATEPISAPSMGDNGRSVRTDPIAVAVALLKRNPDWSARKLAKAAGCAASTLTRSAFFKKAKNLATEKREPRRGSKDASGKIEAVADDG